MPNYSYVTEDGEECCPTCAEGFRARHRMDQVLRHCPSCGSKVRRSIKARNLQIMVKEKHRPGYADYREDLARFPGDPQAFVTTPQAVERLKSQRQREGWLLRDEDWGDMYDTMPKGSLDEGPDLGVDGRELIQEAYEEALEDLGNE